MFFKANDKRKISYTTMIEIKGQLNTELIQINNYKKNRIKY